ncbi:MAG: hypothetical protein JXR27_07415 [Paludibacteraceae bacterium]|nr:hypothetical protein [Paludibacteraceae bacterium]
MKTALKYLIFLLIPFLSSCWENHYDNIPEDQKPELTNNNTLLFIDSLTNTVDTFQIRFSIYYDISDSKYFTELIDLGYNLINTIKDINSFYIRQHYKGVFVYVNSINNYDRIEFNSNQTKPAQQDLLVRGVMYPNTYVLNQYRFETDTLPKTVYYSLKHGIIRYDYADGRKYELVSE